MTLPHDMAGDQGTCAAPSQLSHIAASQLGEARRFWADKQIRTAMLVPWAEAVTAAFTGPIYPFFMQNLGLDAGGMGKLRTVQHALNAASAPIAGCLLDARGPFLGIALPASLCAIGCAIRSMAQSTSWLVAANVFSGLSGAKTEMATAHLSRHTDPSRRTLAVSAARVQLQALALLGTLLFTPTNWARAAATFGPPLRPAVQGTRLSTTTSAHGSPPPPRTAPWQVLTALLPESTWGMLRFRLLISLCVFGCGFGVIVLCCSAGTLVFHSSEAGAVFHSSEAGALQPRTLRRSDVDLGAARGAEVGRCCGDADGSDAATEESSSHDPEGYPVEGRLAGASSCMSSRLRTVGLAAASRRRRPRRGAQPPPLPLAGAAGALPRRPLPGRRDARHARRSVAALPQGALWLGGEGVRPAAAAPAGRAPERKEGCAGARSVRPVYSAAPAPRLQAAAFGLVATPPLQDALGSRASLLLAGCGGVASAPRCGA